MNCTTWIKRSLSSRGNPKDTTPPTPTPQARMALQAQPKALVKQAIIPQQEETKIERFKSTNNQAVRILGFLRIIGTRRKSIVDLTQNQLDNSLLQEIERMAKAIMTGFMTRTLISSRDSRRSFSISPHHYSSRIDHRISVLPLSRKERKTTRRAIIPKVRRIRQLPRAILRVKLPRLALEFLSANRVILQACSQRRRTSSC